MKDNKNYESKYGTVLTMILVIVFVIILGIAGYFLYSIHEKTTINESASKAIADFEQATKPLKKKVNDKENNVAVDNEEEPTINEDIKPDMSAYEDLDLINNQDDNGSVTKAVDDSKIMYEDYEMVGTINIAKTNCKYPILSEVTKHSLEIAVAVLYGPGINQPGNTVIVGHNYRNGLFFSNNSKLANGDTVAITGTDHETVNYIIYNMYYTTPDDASYMRRAVDEGVREISLSTCNNDSSQRLIIWAREQGK